MKIAEAQADLRRAYTDGGPGVIVSGLVWATTAFVEARSGVATAFAVLFVGGMAIYPLGLLANRVLLRRPAEQKGSFGGTVVMEATIAMIAGLFAAWQFIDYRPEWVLPLAAIAVGVHYFPFQSAYGDRRFWLLAALVTAAGLNAIYGFVPLPGTVAGTVAAIEVGFGIALTALALRRS